MNALIEPFRAAEAPSDTVFRSRGEVARLFGVSASTVTRWARTGVLPAVRTPGGHYRFRSEDIRKVVADTAPASRRG